MIIRVGKLVTNCKKWLTVASESCNVSVSPEEIAEYNSAAILKPELRPNDLSTDAVVSGRKIVRIKRLICKPGSSSTLVSAGENSKTVGRIAIPKPRSSLPLTSLRRAGMKEEADLNRDSTPVLENANLQSGESLFNLCQPKRYIDLVSNQETNLALLRWLKLWDNYVFGVDYMTTLRNKALVETLDTRLACNAYDASGKPVLKIVLLYGSPGVGKSACATVIAKHCGYKPIEINASDERSKKFFEQLLDASSSKSECFINSKPTCFIIDEIDGAPEDSVAVLLRAASNVKRKGLTVSRPIICICNDIYKSSLRSVRKVALLINFEPIPKTRIFERIRQIVGEHSLHIDWKIIRQSVGLSEGDIRATIHTIDYLSNLPKSKYNNSELMRNQQSNLFAMWSHLLTKSENSNANLIHALRDFGDIGKLWSRVFDSYLSQAEKFDDGIYKAFKLLECFDWYLQIERLIKTKQDYSLYGYLPFSFSLIHDTVAHSSERPSAMKFSYLSETFAVEERANSVSAHIQKLDVNVARFLDRRTFCTETMPFLSHVIKPGNMKWSTPALWHVKEKKNKDEAPRVSRIETIRDIMMDFQLRYKLDSDGKSINIHPKFLDSSMFFPEVVSGWDITFRETIDHMITLKEISLNVIQPDIVCNKKQLQSQSSTENHEKQDNMRGTKRKSTFKVDPTVYNENLRHAARFLIRQRSHRIGPSTWKLLENEMSKTFKVFGDALKWKENFFKFIDPKWNEWLGLDGPLPNIPASKGDIEIANERIVAYRALYDAKPKDTPKPAGDTQFVTPTPPRKVSRLDFKILDVNATPSVGKHKSLTTEGETILKSDAPLPNPVSSPTHAEVTVNESTTTCADIINCDGSTLMEVTVNQKGVVESSVLVGEIKTSELATSHNATCSSEEKQTDSCSSMTMTSVETQTDSAATTPGNDAEVTALKKKCGELEEMQTRLETEKRLFLANRKELVEQKNALAARCEKLEKALEESNCIHADLTGKMQDEIYGLKVGHKELESSLGLEPHNYIPNFMCFESKLFYLPNSNDIVVKYHRFCLIGLIKLHGGTILSDESKITTETVVLAIGEKSELERISIQYGVDITDATLVETCIQKETFVDTDVMTTHLYINKFEKGGDNKDDKDSLVGLYVSAGNGDIETIHHQSTLEALQGVPASQGKSQTEVSVCNEVAMEIIGNNSKDEAEEEEVDSGYLNLSCAGDGALNDKICRLVEKFYQSEQLKTLPKLALEVANALKNEGAEFEVQPKTMKKKLERWFKSGKNKWSERFTGFAVEYAIFSKKYMKGVGLEGDGDEEEGRKQDV